MITDELIHFILSILVGVIITWLYGNFWAILVALISGFFIDSDHLIDYFIYTKMQRFDLAEFRSAKYFGQMGKVYVFAHGFEYAIILAVLGFFLPHLSWLFYSLALSNFLHLLYDTIANKPIWPTYFLTFRIAKNFDHKAFDFKCQR